MKLSKDGWAGLAVLAASLFLFWLTLGLRQNPLVPIGPGYYPRIVLALTAVLALLVVVFDLLEKGPRAASAGDVSYTMVGAMFAVFGLYVGALPFLGFRIATLIYVAACNALLDPPRSARGWGRVALVAIITTGVIYYTFEHYLTVLLPRGRWTHY